MKALKLNRNNIESLIYIIIWLLVFSVPYFFENSTGEKDWNIIFREWLHLIPFLLVFLVNVYVLVPKLLFNKKYKNYVLYLAIMIIIGIGINFIPMLNHSPHQKPMIVKEVKVRGESNKPPHMVFIDNIIIFVLILGAGTTSKLITKLLTEEQLRKDMEKEQIKTNLELLKNQLNPHFLFNNLSVLSSLVYKSQDKAVDFITELSKVYRYVLDINNSELVLLQDEMEFLDHYIYLLKIRFETSISFSIQIDDSNKNNYLPPMCLQTLVENTIQHNEASQSNPLQISIFTKNNSLYVENSIQPRSDINESSKTGLDNIQARYSFFTEDKVHIIKDDKVFRVILPLITRI